MSKPLRKLKRTLVNGTKKAPVKGTTTKTLVVKKKLPPAPVRKLPVKPPVKKPTVKAVKAAKAAEKKTIKKVVKAAKASTEKIIKWSRSEEREKELAREEMRRKAAAIYEDWSQRTVNTPKPPEALVDAFNELDAELFNAIGKEDPELHQHIVKELIYPAIERSHEFALVIANAKVAAQATCTECATLNVGRDIPYKTWALRAFDLTCAGCGKTIPGVECELHQPIPAEELGQTAAPEDAKSEPPAP